MMNSEPLDSKDVKTDMDKLNMQLMYQLLELPAFSSEGFYDIVKGWILHSMTIEEILNEYGTELPNLVIFLSNQRNYRLRKLLFALIQHQPKLAEEALNSIPLATNQSGPRPKTRLLEALYVTHPNYDARCAKRRLADKEPLVRRAAQIILATQSSVADASQLDARFDEDETACVGILRKKGLHSILWAFPGGVPEVYYDFIGQDNNCAAVDPLIRNAYLMYMLTLGKIQMSPIIHKIHGIVCSSDLSAVGYSIYRNQLLSGNKEHRRSALLFHGIHMSDYYLPEYVKQIDQLISQNQLELACEAVRALSLCGSYPVKEEFERIGREHPNPLIRKAALQQTANQSG